ncbi:chemotaxis protein CheY [Rugosibacter aromaticivorans]|uniref:Chemotaxis protein CheY n=1 Tax=Rugosibacter aromaticivorans TaxID=1565605 RepID=A0A0C5JBK4_9PROT|nr:response regulator [Rugosibacter aromaticivorans]AJP49104.1 chemotaxis protein CheY [Rugosibacter aromaticivorans]TBR14569.1 MAG: response regulator [Rugosibacter sp.]
MTRGIQKVLIIDDSPTERFLLTQILAEGHFEIFTADNGEEGIARAKNLQPDLILMDVVMPGINGFQATRQLSRDEATKNIPIIMCTTKSQQSDKAWGLRQGALDYVTKPVEGPLLLAKIAALGVAHE